MAQAGAPGGGPAAAQVQLSVQLVRDLVRAAVAAPSMHNAQPWRFRVRPGMRVMELYADPARMLPSADPRGRGMHIGCGAALFNLRLAAAVASCQAAVQPFPIRMNRCCWLPPGSPGLTAPVTPSANCMPPSRTGALTAARSVAGRYPPGVLAELAEAAGLEDAILHILDHDETVRILHLAADAESSQLADSAYRAELALWIGGQRDRDGIPDSALGPRAATGLTPVRDFTPARPDPVRYASFEATPQLAVLSTRFSAPADWLRAGQALQRVLLTAAARGVATTPLTQPLETDDAWLVRDPRSGVEEPQMILRLGYGLLVPPTPRRPVSDVLDLPPENLPPAKEDP